MTLQAFAVIVFYIFAFQKLNVHGSEYDINFIISNFII